jgi:hypothetical protein
MSIEKKLFESFVLDAAATYLIDVEHVDFKSYLQASAAVTALCWNNPKYKDIARELDDLQGAAEVEAQRQGFYYGFMCAVEFLKTGHLPAQLDPPEREIKQ